jgi:hypothetical protein
MPRYFFHIRDGWDLIPDDEGIVFPGLDQAEAEGYASARDLAAAGAYEGHSFAAYAVEVADGAGNILRRIKIEPLSRVA